uniref:Uncharacterized protein n=1 Tax=Ficedula albicollis TaxID=59894 RepID=A0A803VK67_FICAL
MAFSINPTFPGKLFHLLKSTASTSASRKRLDTAQMATTSHTLVAAAAAAAPSSTGAAEREPDAAEDPAAAASAASAGSSSETLSVAVAERAGSPWSRTTMRSELVHQITWSTLCILVSLSLKQTKKPKKQNLFRSPWLLNFN